MMAFLLLLGSVGGYYYGLARLTTFVKIPPEPAPKAAAK